MRVAQSVRPKNVRPIPLQLKKTVDATMDSMHQLAASVTFDLASSFVHTRHGKEIGNAIAIPVIHFAGVPHPYTNKDMTAVRGKLLDVEAYHVQVRLCKNEYYAVWCTYFVGQIRRIPPLFDRPVELKLACWRVCFMQLDSSRSPRRPQV